jgi:hypothetical protein
MDLQSELVLELSVDIGETLDIGQTAAGYLRVIPITGGTFGGEDIRGVVVPGGVDWNTQREDGAAHVFAKYTLRTTDGAYIGVQNEGVIAWNQADSVVRTTPQFQVDQNGKYAWLGRGVYAGTLRPRADGSGVEIQVFRLA